MEVDRTSEWMSVAVLRPKYEAPRVAAQVQAEPKKRKSLFKRKSQGGAAGAECQPQEALQSPKSQEEEMQMESFFARRLGIRKHLHTLSLLLLQIDKNNKEQLVAADEDRQVECDQVAEALSQEMNKTSTKIRTELSELKAENDSLAPVAPTGSGYLRMRQVQYAALLRQFTTLMCKLQAAQRAGQQQSKDSIRRQLAIVSPDASEADIEAVCTDPTASMQLRSSLFAVASRQDSQRILEQMQSRRQSMFKVEQGIAVIAQLYNDMYALLQEQQGNLDSLETFIGSTVDYLDKAAVEMETAVGHQKNIRKMKCAIF